MLETILWAIAILLGTSVGVTGWFFALAKAAELKDNNVDLGKFIEYNAYVYLGLGVVLDVLFNWIFGTWIYRELPREFLFTDRTKRHFNSISGPHKSRRQKQALKWAERMNKIMPGHV